MAKTIKFGDSPSEQDIAWFVKHIGPRTHYLPNSIGGKGWRFTLEKINYHGKIWNLTVDDEKMLMYWTLVRD
jgi:hypothetical protein